MMLVCCLDQNSDLFEVRGHDQNLLMRVIFQPSDHPGRFAEAAGIVMDHGILWVAMSLGEVVRELRREVRHEGLNMLIQSRSMEHGFSF
jgi:hypothetical protein